MQRVGEVLHRQTDRLSRLVEDLMMLARLEAREFTLRPEIVELGAHIDGLVEAHRQRAEGMEVELVATLDEVGDVVIDPDRVDQILGNLIENALRYTPAGGSVTVTLQGGDEWVSLGVADTGAGIEADDVPRVFERLYVAQRYQPVRPEGSGLGLSIVKELTEALGGWVEFVSAPDLGTTVTVRLPRGRR
jgi:signal transduction histidine kinase